MLTKNLLALKNILLGLAIGWTASVAVLCLISFSTLPAIEISDADKYVHATFHFVFTMLWGMYFWKKQHEIRIERIISIVVISLSFGILIEFLQETLTTTRHADVLDVAANLTGALIALCVFVFIKTRKKQNNWHYKLSRLVYYDETGFLFTFILWLWNIILKDIFKKHEKDITLCTSFFKLDFQCAG